VLSAAQQRNHPRGIVCVPGLAEDFAIYDDDCVRADRDQIRITLSDRARLLSCQPLGVTPRSLSRAHGLVDVGWTDFVCDPDQVEELAPAR
jgi:hypothetical protein